MSKPQENNIPASVEDKLSTEKKLMIARFESSELIGLLSEDERNVLLTAIEDGDEVTMKSIRKMLDEEDERKSYFDNIIEESMDNEIEPMIQAFRRKKTIDDIKRREMKSEHKDDDSLNNLLN